MRLTGNPACDQHSGLVPALATLDAAFDYRAIARATPGYVGADMVSLAKEAAVCAVNRAFKQLFSTADGSSSGNSLGDADWIASTAAFRETAPLSEEQMAGLNVTFNDFLSALPKVQPSATREGFATIPNVTWADVGALADVRMHK
jgi:ribosome biogenesis ATPase